MDEISNASEPNSGPDLVRPVILCGGSGTRLWPASRATFPKQLVRFEAEGATLLQGTIARVISGFAEPLLVTHEEHRFQVKDQLEQIGVHPAAIIVEQVARNTASAIAVAAEWIKRNSPGELMLVLPSDHLMADPAAFAEAIRRGRSAALAGKLVTFGITPKHPVTGYGYIRARGSDVAAERVLKVEEFVEKPDLQRARKYCSSGEHYWNAGIFLFRADAFMAELSRLAPQIAEFASHAAATGQSDGMFFRPGEPAATEPPSLSIDYAVMERTDDAVVVPMDPGWSDVGSWDAVWEMAEQDSNGNVLSGEVVAIDTIGSLVRSESGITVAALGLQDVVVVATRDAVLVTPRERSEDIRKVVDVLKAAGNGTAQAQSKVHRPWGTYESTDRGENFQSKRIVVKPGARLSLQKHRYRSEHWIVVKGVAEVTVGEETTTLHENQSTYIPVGTVHRLSNPGSEPLHLIEVQCGTYLGEDDIVRFDDVYGRAV